MTVTAGRLHAQGVGKAAWRPLHVGSDGALVLDAASREQEACLLQGDIKLQVASSGPGLLSGGCDSPALCGVSLHNNILAALCAGL